jgi:uncharacterized membrane protein
MSEARPNAVLVLIAAYAAVVFAVLMRWVGLNPGSSPPPYLVQAAVVDLFGTSAFVVQVPAALCSIAEAAVFAALCGRFGVRSPAWATALFLALPLQFRYALEAREYSQGLLCALASLLLFLRARERAPWERRLCTEHRWRWGCTRSH